MSPAPRPAQSDADVELEQLWLRYRALWRHVNHDHGQRAEGNANQLEAVHMAAHRAEGSAWHNAWQLPSEDQR